MVRTTRLSRLRVGDLTRCIQAAWADHPAALTTQHVLLVTLQFWRSAWADGFLCSQVVTQDLSAVLGALRARARSFSFAVMKGDSGER